MNRTIKILIAASAIFLLIGVVSATDLVDIFEAPSGFTVSANDTFTDNLNHNIQIFNFTDELYTKWFKNDTTFSINQFKDGAFFPMNSKNHYGILEIVEKDDNKYIIESWTSKNPNEANTLKKNLEEFNKINDLKPTSK